MPASRCARSKGDPTMRRLLTLKIARVSLAFAACITVNVYFPAAAADKAADQVIDKITKGSDGSTPPQGYRAPAPSTGEVLLAAVGNVLYAIVPAAQAQ